MVRLEAVWWLNCLDETYGTIWWLTNLAFLENPHILAQKGG